MSSQQTGPDRAKTDPHPPPPPRVGDLNDDVRVETFTLDPSASRDERIAQVLARSSLTLAEAVDLVDGSPTPPPT
ncbi:hypothetical protein [Lapillicoccus jejuensis]|uniref:Uncharacterized protein n=1 Tax=Lapillicoccus jejuensis TaxID=402171 RepID=A0A542E528_9MICO|nr:hypothetical protein [Lapillicoccus jejuensis]TQJ10384.1 hypothetical protein FB458_3505 [Lapillicoccus jejuensis]